MLNMAIVDDDIPFGVCMERFFSGQRDFFVAGVARDGESGLRLILDNPVDVALIDLALPGKDGFYILEELSRCPEKKPVSVVLSGMGREHVTTKALNAGADYFVVKPFDLDLLARRIREFCQARTDGIARAVAKPSHLSLSQESFVIKFLHDLPIANSVMGYEFLKTAILMAINDPTQLDGITKNLYPAVAKQHKSSSSKVERAVRHAIESAWRRGGGQRYAELLGYGSPNGPKPTNSAFIAAVVELYRYQSKEL